MVSAISHDCNLARSVVILLREGELGHRKVKQLPTFPQLVVTELELGLASALVFPALYVRCLPRLSRCSASLKALTVPRFWRTGCTDPLGPAGVTEEPQANNLLEGRSWMREKGPR